MNKKKTTLILIILVLFNILHFVALTGDPSLFVSDDIITDEGWFSQNARNHFLFNQWVLDDHNPAFALCPIYTLVIRLFFQLLGNSILVIRLISATAFILIQLLIIIRLKNYPKVLFTILLLLTLNPLLFAYFRTGFVEPLQCLGMTFVWFFTTSDNPKRKKLNPYLSGVFSGLTVFIKPTILITSMISLFGPLLIHTSIKEKIRRVYLSATGFLTIIVFFVPFLTANKAIIITEFSREGQILDKASGLGGIISPVMLGFDTMKGGSIQPNLYYFAIIFPLCAIWLMGLISQNALIKHEKKTDLKYITDITILWLLLKLVSYFPQRLIHIQPRYWIGLFIPVSILVAFSSSGIVFFDKKRRKLLFSFLLWYLLRPVILIPFALVNNYSYSLFFLCYLLISIITYLMIVNRQLRFGPVPKKVKWPILIFILLAWSLFIMVEAVTVQFTQKHCIDEITELIGEESVVTGDVANTMSIESNRYAFVTRDLSRMRMGTDILNPDWKKKNVQYLIVTSETDDFTNLWRPSGTFEIIYSEEILRKSPFSDNMRFRLYVLRWKR